MNSIVPLQHPKPDAREFVEILAGKSRSKRVPLIEYIVDDVVMRPVVVDLLGRAWSPFGPDRKAQEQYLDNLIAFWYRMGYDVVRFELSLPFKEHMHIVQDATPGSDKERSWPDEHSGTITSRLEFEAYRWPEVKEFDFHPFEYLNRNLPDGMGLIACHGGGVFEHLSWIMSFEGLCTALYEDPDLVRDVANSIGKVQQEFYRNLLDLSNLVAVFPGDDMGYRKATMISPDLLRRHVLPWHKRFAKMTHDRGLPYFLHSCGNVLGIMEDLIDDVGIDGKHSYEDAVVPVQEFQSRYGKRIAVLGGLDINILSAASPEEVAERTRFLLQTCGREGRYAVGSGNSVPSYIPVPNYLAMIRETHKHGSEQI
jgi:uroporphyrinogen decarboxylase